MRLQPTLDKNIMIVIIFSFFRVNAQMYVIVVDENVVYAFMVDKRFVFTVINSVFQFQ